MAIDKIVFLCGARDYHAMDWYRSAQKLINNSQVLLLTDLIGGEEFKIIVNENDTVHKLLVIDRFLFKKQSSLGNKWRNLLKFILIPIQAFLVRSFFKKHPDSVFHAHGMYYMFLAAVAKVPYVGTPQGSEILVRPFKSNLYRLFSKKALNNSLAVTVDSKDMQDKVELICGVKAHIIQNGVDIEALNPFIEKGKRVTREYFCSIRGFTPLYRINEIVESRNSSETYSSLPLNFIYPFYEDEYKSKVQSLLRSNDFDRGRLDRVSMYDLFTKSKLIFSIPYSDSSPRSVYESIFCGAIVAITYNTYYETLPDCMKSRIIIVDLDDNQWFDKAIFKAQVLSKTPYYPSEEALTVFNQKKSFELLSKLYFNS